MIDDAKCHAWYDRSEQHTKSNPLAAGFCIRVAQYYGGEGTKGGVARLFAQVKHNLPAEVISAYDKEF